MRLYKSDNIECCEMRIFYVKVIFKIQNTIHKANFHYSDFLGLMREADSFFFFSLLNIDLLCLLISHQKDS